MTPGPRILVSGAAGTHGIKGPFLVEELVDGGYPVRAMVRVRDQRSEFLESIGAEVVVADFQSYADMCVAMEGIERAYFCYPFAPGIVEASVNFAAAAAECRVETVVNLSLMVARADAPSRVARGHWMSERIFDWADVHAVHVRGGFFFENVFELAGPDAGTSGVLDLPFAAGRAKIAWISGTDVARFVSAVLRDPDAYHGKTCLLSGHVYSFSDIADLLGQSLGHDVQYDGVPFDEWERKAHLDHLQRNPTLHSHVRMLSGLFSDDRTFGRETPTFSEATGRAPESFAQFLEIAKAAPGGYPGR